MKQLTFGSLFAGIGGFDLGFERAGMQCQWQVELDDYATQVLEEHWPDVRRHRDICTFPPEPLDEWRVDVICGGFPCQDISYAGRGAGLDGERSGLFYEAMRVVRVLEPRVVVLENVAALLTNGLPEVLGSLASLGFDAEWHCIPAAAVGAPHIRDRVFIYAYGEGESILPINAEVAGVSVSANASEPRLPTLEQETLSGSRRWEEGRTTAQCGRWATEPDVGRVAHGVPSRVDRLKCLGNAVVPDVAEWIGRRIIEALQGVQR